MIDLTLIVPKNPVYLLDWFLDGCEEAEIIPGIYVAISVPRYPVMREWIGDAAQYAEQRIVPAKDWAVETRIEVTR